MKKLYRLKDGVDIKELAKYGYRFRPECFACMKEVKKTSRKKTNVWISEYKERFVCVVNSVSFRLPRTIYSFGKNEMPYIQDLLDAGLLEKVK